MHDIKKFAVYKHRLVNSDGDILTRQFIVLKDENGNIVQWTDFHRYARSGKKKMSKNVSSDGNMRCYHAVAFLNYIFFGKYRISRLIEVEAVMVKDFLNDYGLGRLPLDKDETRRGKSTVDTCISHILDFLDLMIRANHSCRMKIADLYSEERIFDKRRRRYITKKVPVFEVNYRNKTQPIFRDITEEAFQIIMNVIIDKHTNILMLAALSAFAGLRPSESCNVRRSDSILGPGLRFEMRDGEVINVVIDLREEKNLRSDGKSVGKIKKEREQKVYPAFLNVFMECYNTYMEFIEGRQYEADYGALTTTSTGKAYTYDAYYKEFQSVVKEAIPVMLASGHARTVHYGMLLQEHSISPHILRHWFSMKLTIYGEDVAGLMTWRGDKSPESALTYISNKSELVDELEKVSDEAFHYTLWKAGKMENGGNQPWKN